MDKYLVLGAKGQLGTDCLQVFSARDIVGVDLPEVDASDRVQCMDFLNQHRPDVVINCAAFTAVDACESEKEVCWKVNADVPSFLSEWVAENNSYLVHVSTDYVFAGNKPLYTPSVESDGVGPVSEYGRSKLAGEERVMETTDRAAILRTAWLYGQNGKNFLKTMLRLTLQHPEKEFKVVNDQYGSPTWSHTLARQICAVTEKQETGLFHATSEGYCSWYDLACAFLTELDIEHRFVPCTTDEYPTSAQRPFNSILENKRLKAAGINLFSDWREELKEYVTRCGADVLQEVRSQL